MPGLLPLLVGHFGDRVPEVDPGVVHHHVEAAQAGHGRLDHQPDGVGVGQVGADDRVAVTGQPGQDLLRQRRGVTVMHRHPVALPGERLRHRPANAPGGPGDEDRPAQFSSHRESSLVAVAQFLAVAASPLALPGRGADDLEYRLGQLTGPVAVRRVQEQGLADRR